MYIYIYMFVCLQTTGLYPATCSKVFCLFGWKRCARRMASWSATVDMLADACRGGDAYSGLQVFKAALQRKARKGEEPVVHEMLDAAFDQVAVPTRSAEVASELCDELFRLLTFFGRKRDLFVLARLRAIRDKFMGVAESEATVAWCRSSVEFLRSAQGWWKARRDEACSFASGLAKEEAEKDVESVIAFIHEALCRAYLRLAHCTANDANSGDDAICEALAAAYYTSHLCISEIKLIQLVAYEVRERLTLEEKPFLIARTIYGVLSGAANGVQKTSRDVALKAAESLLQQETLIEEGSALYNFLRDLLTIMEAASRVRGPPLRKKALGHDLVEELCKSYSLALWALRDLNWVTLARSF